MEKRKVFKISIIDKEISRTEFDRNTFYTSDSELTLVFKLIEKDYSYDHGEILLYNEDDKSFVTRQITKQGNDFVYELDLDIIPHYGKWQAQLQLVNDGDIYTSKPFDFSIVNDLSNLAPQPTLTDINNWSTLKQSANELIDEMQDIIVNVENSELERVSKENYRQQIESVRVNQENIRQNGELTRVRQENKRQNGELDRDNNEKQRRIAEFGRVDKENKRQQAENERVDAESTRVNAEEQRKIDHANRSAELDGKANKQQEDWVTPTLLNGATGTIQFRKNEFGRVEFKGLATHKDGTLLMILPVGYRPLVNISVLGVVDSSVPHKRVQIYSNGNIYFAQPYTTSTTVDMSGVSFPT